ncbi:VPLPA-CTERM sorting domain-containing protein [Palleronia sp. LCG004]|uniref:VPLPA-CTERM sorting domain-containing protein n=1 Tax=Palleronia sp. LCG004 TaxID=3079304 RepID=UPI002942893E|nr:VPLPA-CTERM sorting domain-containing protein [Palleronia sp. LCG004]WOI54940.1 VPLPA-CTERM sorting domain-containing protein [Palleronia sp. LCG004]
MSPFIIAVVALAVSVVNAEAAVYRYDVSMERNYAGYFSVSGSSDFFPDEVPTGVSCQGPAPLIQCDGFGAEDAFTMSDLFPLTTTATYIFDTASPNANPFCIGSGPLCRALEFGITMVTASPSGFTVDSSLSAGGYFVDQDRLFYADDGQNPFSFGGVDYKAGGITVSYNRTGLNISEVSPIPLPASLPMLCAGIALIGFLRRRTT